MEKIKEGKYRLNINKKYILDLLHLNDDSIEDRESEELEFKEQFSLAALSEYYRDFAGFANNKGGYLVFGVKDSPRIPVGLNQKSLERFKEIDPQRITGELLETFSANIQLVPGEVYDEGKTYGVFKVLESARKPVIAKKNYGKKQSIKAGEIYYRYAGRTQKIRYEELEEIIQSRIERVMTQWMDLMSTIVQIGPENATILKIDGDRQFDHGKTPIVTIDEEFVSKIKDINEINQLDAKDSENQNNVNDILPIIGVIPNSKENLFKTYPLSAKELDKTVREVYPSVMQYQVWKIIKQNKIKDNPEYSIYVFRNKKQEDQYKESGIVPKGIPSIYNEKAVDFIITTLKGNEDGSNVGNQDT